MNDIHQQVEDWLSQVFGGETIPRYEINHTTLECLHQLMEKHQQQEALSAKRIEDIQNKATEYSLEAERLGDCLSQLGLTPSALSQSGSVSLRTLVTICLTLDVRDASNTVLLLALSEACQRSVKLAEARRREQMQCAQLVQNTTSAMQHSAHLTKALQNLEEQVKHQKPELDKKIKQSGFLQTKGREYKSHIQSLKKELTSSGADPAIYHSTLHKKAEELQELKSKLHPMKAKLDAYHKLPPDLELALVKVEEARQELQGLEKELSSYIDLMHM